MYDALNKNDLTNFSEILNEGWETKKKFTNGITNELIEKINKKLKESGADALKVTGAGGGGHVYVYAPKSKHKKIINGVSKLGVFPVKFQYLDTGAQVFDVSNL